MRRAGRAATAGPDGGATAFCCRWSPWQRRSRVGAFVRLSTRRGVSEKDDGPLRSAREAGEAEARGAREAAKLKHAAQEKQGKLKHPAQVKQGKRKPVEAQEKRRQKKATGGSIGHRADGQIWLRFDYQSLLEDPA